MKKSDQLNKNYPILGFRVSKEDRDEIIERFDSLLDLLRTLPEYRRLNLKKNAVFLRALEIGIEHLKKKRTLG